MTRHALRAGEHARAGYEHYLQRKRGELELIEAYLPPGLPGLRTEHLSTLLRRKFKSAAQCRADMASAQWSQTETRWQKGPCGAGAFQFDYAYQRADLEVQGPDVYAAVKGLSALRAPQYTSSGMAALSASMLAMRRLWPKCRFDARSDGYPETRELIALLGDPPGEYGPRVVILDSTVDTWRSARLRLAGAQAAIFDTSCYCSSSCRIRAISMAALGLSIPLVLVRSHTKLDCLGLDYGRLGSIVVAKGATAEIEEKLNALIADYVRLSGSAPYPLHFPPFAAGARYHTLTRGRIAWAIRSTRHVVAGLRAVDGVALRTFSHGLYVVLFPQDIPSKHAASAAARDLVARLEAAGVPARHAGSFGFDFIGSDWFEDPATEAFGVRVSMGDLPSSLVERAAREICGWSREHAGTQYLGSAPNPLPSLA